MHEALPGQLYLPDDQFGMFKQFVFKRYGMSVPEITNVETEPAFDIVRNALIGTYIHRKHLSFVAWDYDSDGNLTTGLIVDRKSDGEEAFYQLARHSAERVVDGLRSDYYDQAANITIEVPRMPSLLTKLRRLSGTNKSITVISHQPHMADETV